MDPDDAQPRDTPEPDSQADEPAPAPAETTGPIDRENLAPAPAAPPAPPKFGTDRMWSDPARDYAAGPLPLEHEGFTRNIETGVLTGARWVDRLQSRVGPVAFTYAVFKKYFDDEGSRLAALMAYYTFISLIPLAVGCLAVLAQVLRDRPGAVENIVADVVPHAYQAQVLAAYSALPTSGAALWVALIGLFLSGTAGVFSLYAAVNQVFAVPYRHRYGFGPRYARVFLVVFIMASAVLAVGVGSSVVGSLFDVPGANRLLVLVGSVALFSTAFYWSVKILSRRVLRAHELLLGCVLGGLVVTGFASLGSMLIGRFSASSTPVYGALASVIAVLSVMLLAANGLVMSLEISIVRAWQLWPRGIDIHLLFPADERAYVLLSVMDERMPSQRNDVRFDADGHFDPRRLPLDELDHRQPGVPRTPYDPDPPKHHGSAASETS